MIRSTFILGLLCLSCASFSDYIYPIDRPACRFGLKNSIGKYGFFKTSEYEIKVSAGTLGCNYIGITIEMNTSETLLINIYNLKIGYKGRDVGYWCKFNGKKPKYSIAHIKNINNIIYYGSEHNLDLTKGDEFMIYAEDYISCGDRTFSIDTLTFVVIDDIRRSE